LRNAVIQKNLLMKLFKMDTTKVSSFVAGRSASIYIYIYVVGQSLIRLVQSTVNFCISTLDLNNNDENKHLNQ